jgi:hypothetical protein
MVLVLFIDEMALYIGCHVLPWTNELMTPVSGLNKLGLAEFPALGAFMQFDTNKGPKCNLQKKNKTKLKTLKD